MENLFGGFLAAGIQGSSGSLIRIFTFKKKFSLHLQTYGKSYIIKLYASWHAKKGEKREFKEEWLMVTAVVGANWGD